MHVYHSMMHVPFEAIAWLHLIHRNADLLLLISIASLGLLPLVSIYIIETEKLDAEVNATTTTTTLMSEAPTLIKSFLRVVVYLAILFPYLLALLSTYVSVQLVRHQGFHYNSDNINDTFHMRSWTKAISFLKNYQNIIVLKKEDVANREDDAEEEQETTDTAAPKIWRIPSPGSSESDNGTTRLVEADCIICMHPYQVDEQLVWSSNPKCIHCFHLECLQAWMEPRDHVRSNNQRCPCCRQDFFQ